MPVSNQRGRALSIKTMNSNVRYVVRWVRARTQTHTHKGTICVPSKQGGDSYLFYYLKRRIVGLELHFRKVIGCCEEKVLAGVLLRCRKNMGRPVSAPGER